MNNTRCKKLLAILLAAVLIIGLMTGCASLNRMGTDIKSEFGNGLDRVINVYTANGDLIATYEGKIDIESQNSYVKFDFEGKRYIYYNCFFRIGSGLAKCE